MIEVHIWQLSAAYLLAGGLAGMEEIRAQQEGGTHSAGWVIAMWLLWPAPAGVDIWAIVYAVYLHHRSEE